MYNFFESKDFGKMHLTLKSYLAKKCVCVCVWGGGYSTPAPPVAPCLLHHSKIGFHRFRQQISRPQAAGNFVDLCHPIY